MVFMDSLDDLFQAYRTAQSLEAKRAAADAIVFEAHPELWIFVRPRLDSHHDAGDLLQETFMGIFKSLPLYRGHTRSEAFGFCYRIARNRLVDYYRRKARSLVEFGGDDAFMEFIEAWLATEPSDAPRIQDLRDALDILAASKPDCLRYFGMRFALDMGYKEIGNELGIADDAARQRVERCLDRAKTIILKGKSYGR